MQTIHWELDRDTAYWANRIRLPDNLHQAEQYPGHRMFKETWLPKIGSESTSHNYNHKDEGYWECSPCNIIKCFQDEHFLTGLAFTVSWGGMSRVQKQIYGDLPTPDFEKIRSTLSECKGIIDTNGNIKSAWNILTGKLGWGQVITSKVLHFLTRSCNYEGNPPVPFDNAVTWNQINPWFFTSIHFQRRQQDLLIPQAWWDDNHSWEGYNRYMTAVVCWSLQLGWTTTVTEVSIFNKLREPQVLGSNSSEIEGGEKPG